MSTAKFEISHLAKKPRAKAKAKSKAKSKPTTQEERDEAMKKNWGTEAYKTIQKFRKIWDKEGAKLE